jgi:acyl carrier protein
VAGAKRLVAYYTFAPGLSETAVESATADTLRAFLSAVLPEYMVPSAYVELHQPPLTSNGKLDREALPAPDGEAYAARSYVAPEGETEIALAEMWVDLLKIERVGRHDNFFDLGGHSLLVMKLIGRMQIEFGIRIAIQDFFSNPTLTSLAKLTLHAQLEQFAPEEISALVDRLR